MKTGIIGGTGFVGTRLIEEIGIDSCVNIDKKVSLKFPQISILQNICDEGLTDKIPVNIDTIVLLAAEHRDDVSPISLYYQVNVQGTKNVLNAMDEKGIKKIIFTSSVAVYGLGNSNPNEEHITNPFNHYGKSKLAAEQVLKEWYDIDPKNRSVTIIRPTVIFGERNRGNVYNLLKQISSGKFVLVGNGKNIKSIAYVGNIVSLIHFFTKTNKIGYNIFNYVDKPDMTMQELVKLVEVQLSKKIIPLKLPYWFGFSIGLIFDLSSKITGKKFSISSVRVKKFCATTQFDASKVMSTGFTPSFSLMEGLSRTLKYEFEKNSDRDDITFISE